MMIRKLFFSTLLISAGLAHIIDTTLFLNALPDFLIYKNELILLTGIFEILLGVGILFNKTRNLSAKLSTYYLILLIPVHIYVSINGIEMFGVSNKLLLWMRTFFQYPLIILANSFSKDTWVIEQIWRHVFFIHYKIDPELIKHKIPFELDLHEESAVVSIVPFYMEGIRFPFLPAIPIISSLWEINLRTYVEVDGVKGIYFFTLDTDSALAKIIAEKIFYLPYRYSKIKADINNGKYDFSHQRDEYAFELKAEILDEVRHTNEFDTWATERYCLFTLRKNMIYQGTVLHVPWKLRSVKIGKIKNHFTSMLFKENLEPVDSMYSTFLKVRFNPFKKIREL